MHSQLDNMLWGAGPKDEAVPVVSEPRLDFGILKTQQEGVDDELVILGRQEFLLLLGISSRAMGGIECLDLGLQSCQPTHPEDLFASMAREAGQDVECPQLPLLFGGTSIQVDK